MFGPVTGFVGERGIKAFRVAEAFDRWQLDVVAFLGVVGLAAAIPDIGLTGREERVGVFDTLDRRELRLRPHIIFFRQAFDLIEIEHGIAVQESNQSRC